MRRVRRGLTIVAFTALVGCTSPVLPATLPMTHTVTLRVYTTTAALPLMNDLTAHYSQLNPGIIFDSVVGDYQVMVKRLNEGEMPYFLSNHLPLESTLWAAPIGQDGIAVIVHSDASITQISTEQLRDIYEGRIVNWRDVGGSELPIVVISREDGSGTRAEFDRLVMGERPTTPDAQVVPSSQAMLTRVSEVAGSIGYVSFSYVNSSVQVLSVDGVDMTLNNVANNTYPLRSTLYVVGLAEPQVDYRAFIGWIQSLDGQAVVARHYAPLVTLP